MRFVIAVAFCFFCRAAFAQSAPDAGTGPQDAGPKSEPATVLTYFGLRALELDPQVSDEEKLREWEAFLERTQKEQIPYAKQAIQNWKNAARVRVLESVQKLDENPNVSAAEKVSGWERVLVLYTKPPENALAKRRIAYWSKAETTRLIEAAESVERAKGSKLDRIRAWRAVLAWVKQGPEAKAATLRINALEDQLVSEAQSLDKIARIDGQMKLEVWRDVLAADPKPAHRKLAEKRVQELELEVKAAPKTK